MDNSLTQDIILDVFFINLQLKFSQTDNCLLYRINSKLCKLCKCTILRIQVWVIFADSFF